MRAIGVGASDVGRKRENNEDAFLVDDALGLYVVSDGMGGHAAGEVASRKTVEAVRLHFEEQREVLGRFHEGELTDAEAAALVDGAVQRACRSVHHLATQSPRYAGMGATLTLLLIGAGKAAMAHVGDTRLYLLRDGKAHVLSTDHKLGEEMVKAGIMTRENLAKSPYRNALTRSIGNQERVKADTLVIDLLAGDRFVLCTDGLHDHLQVADDLSPYFEGEDLSRVAQALIAFSNTSGGHDNVTVVAIQIAATEDGDEHQAGDEAKRSLEVLGESFLFEGLSWKKLAHVFQIARVVETEAGQRLVSVGEEVTTLFLVQEGRLRFEQSGAPGRDLSQGQLFGERAILQRRRARGDLLVEEPGRVLVIDLEDLRALFQHRPWLGLMIVERLVRKLIGDLDTLEQIPRR